MKSHFLVLTTLVIGMVAGCYASREDRASSVRDIIDASGAEVGLYYRDLGSGDSLMINPDLRMHAASTMKVPIMIQAFLDFESGRLNTDSVVPVRNEFSSIVDGSPYSLSLDDDSDSAMYDLVGNSIAISELIVPMITMSSNLATNMLVEFVGADRAQSTMRELGADSIAVLRGVEDIKAYEAGLSNTATARDLGVIFEALASGSAAGPESTSRMMEILEAQHFNEGIPSGLPPDALVAHKTGSITRIRHDGGVVQLPDGTRYVLIVLVRGMDDGDEADRLIAALSREVFEELVVRR